MELLPVRLGRHRSTGHRRFRIGPGPWQREHAPGEIGPLTYFSAKLVNLFGQGVVAFRWRPPGPRRLMRAYESAFSSKATRFIRWYSGARCRARTRSSASEPSNRGCSRTTGCRRASQPDGVDWAKAGASPARITGQTDKQDKVNQIIH